jgi:MFS family permease
MSEVWAYLRDNRATFLCLNLGVAMATLNAYATSSWVPSMFIRRYGWTPQEIGLVFGLIVGIAGALGIVSGGRLADWLTERGHRDATLRIAGFASLAWLPFGVAYPLMPDATWAAVLVTPAVCFSSVPFGVAPAAIQHMMPNTMRAQATAVYLFVINLIGMGLGPTVVAALTEDVFHDKQSVHYSLAIVGGCSQTVAGILLLAGLKRYRRSLEYFREWNDARTKGE